MTDGEKRESERFPLRLPPDLNREVRALARGSSTKPPARINDTILFLVRKGLEAIRAEQEPA